MKVMQINCVYKMGSTGKITYDIHYYLQKKGYESVVCFGRGKNLNEKNVYKTSWELYSKFNNLFSRLSGYMYGGCILSTLRLIRLIKKEKPDIVHIQCINGYFVNIYKLVEWLKNNDINTVLTLHAEFMYTANCGHSLDCDKWKNGCGNCPRLHQETNSLFFDKTSKSWLKMKKAFDGFNNIKIVSVSPWLMNRAKSSPILENKKHYTIFNGLDTNIFKYYDTKMLRENLQLKNEKVILHVTPSFVNDINHIKGGYYVLKLAEMLKNHNVKVLIVGPHDISIKVPNNVILVGPIKDQTLLAKYYSMADVTLLTSKKETFSMVTAESLCCGTPVVGFEAGAPEQIALKEYSRFVEYGNIDILCNMVEFMLNSNFDKNTVCKKSLEKYSYEKMVNNYIKIYDSFMENEK